MSDRKHELARQLNSWKDVFRTQHGRGPGLADVRADPAASALYDEYLTVRNASSDAAPSTADSSSSSSSSRTFGGYACVVASELGINPLREVPDDVFPGYLAVPLEEGPLDDRLDSTLTFHGDFLRYPSEQDPNAPPRVMHVGESSSHQISNLSNEQKRRKNECGRIVTEWKNKFVVDHGRNPHTEDYKKHPRVYAALAEYQRLRAIKYGTSDHQ
jgi:hypothetical protein